MENQTMMQFFEWDLPPDALLWRRISAQAEKLKASGIDLLWLPPAYKGAQGIHDTGYGVYDLYDLGEFDQKGSISTKYGTAQEYINCVSDAQAAGLQIIADIVLNQRLGADETEEIRAVEVNQNDRNAVTSGEQEVTVWTKYICPGRAGKYSPFQWNWMCFTGTDYDAATGRNSLFRFVGKEWSPFVSGERGNYDYLMGCDVDVNHPETAAELKRWGAWYVQCSGIDGLRIDAAKHLDRKFQREWLNNVREETGKPLFAVAEYWAENLEELKTYAGETTENVSLFDVPLHMHFYRASTSRGQYDMSQLLTNTVVDAMPGQAVTFVDNHDSQPGQSLESWVEEWFKPLAYAVILLREGGLPCIFYPDYYGLRGEAVPQVPGVRRMLQVRKRYAYGTQHDYFDNPNVVGWTREGDAQHQNSACAVVITDGEGGDKNMYIGSQHAGKTFRDIIRRKQNPVVVDGQGNATFSVAGGGVSVWLLQEAYEEIAIHYD